MVRVATFLALLLGLALGLAWVADRPGSVVVTWLGSEYRTDILPALIGLLAAAVAIALVWNVLRLIFRLPSIMAMASRSRRRQKGYQAVSRGMVAVSAGDARLAVRHAAEARRFLGEEPLTMLLSAQSAQLSSDGAKAEAAFNAMLEHGDTRIVGLRGLHMEAQRRNDEAAARFYADEAYKLAPSADWASDAALTYRCRDRDWLGAMALVEQAASRRLIDKETARRQRAVLLTADALDRAPREPDAAFRAAQEAVRLDPSLPPAAAFLGRKTSEKGEYSRASKMLEAAWTAAPHPDVAEAYLDVRLGDSALDRLKRARTLLRLAPRDPESRLVMGRAAIDAREFRTARENLETLVLEHPTVRACVLMAQLEEADSGNMGLVREWLARASRAERDKAWVADGQVLDAWAPISPITGRLGGCVWTTPPQAPGAMLIEEIKAAPMLVEAAPPPTPPEPEPKAEALRPEPTPPPPPPPPKPEPKVEAPRSEPTAQPAPRHEPIVVPPTPEPAPSAPAAIAVNRADAALAEPEPMRFMAAASGSDASRSDESAKPWYLRTPALATPEPAPSAPASIAANRADAALVEPEPMRFVASAASGSDAPRSDESAKPWYLRTPALATPEPPPLPSPVLPPAPEEPAPPPPMTVEEPRKRWFER